MAMPRVGLFLGSAHPLNISLFVVVPAGRHSPVDAAICAWGSEHTAELQQTVKEPRTAWLAAGASFGTWLGWQQELHGWWQAPCSWLPKEELRLTDPLLAATLLAEHRAIAEHKAAQTVCWKGLRQYAGDFLLHDAAHSAEPTACLSVTASCSSHAVQGCLAGATASALVLPTASSCHCVTSQATRTCSKLPAST